jgi:hypothetical protein
MPVEQGDIQYRLSGGSANNNPDNSLGGAISSVSIVNASFENMFDSISNAEATVGDIEYRCFYVRNDNETDELTSPVIWIASNTVSSNDEIDIGLGTSAVNGTEQIVGSESTAPAGVTFSHPTSLATGLALGTLDAGDHKAFWIRRTVSVSAAQFENNSFTLAVEGATV